MALYIPDFEGQSQRALQTGLGLGQAIRQKGLTSLKEQQMQQQLQAGQLGMDQQRQQLQAGELGIQQAQGKISAQQDQMERIAFVDALNMAIATKDDNKRAGVYADLKRQFGQKPGVSEFLDDMAGKSYNEQIQSVFTLNQALSGKIGEQQKPTTSMQNFAEFKRLEKENPEAAKQFGLKEGYITESGEPAIKVSDVNTINKGVREITQEYKDVYRTAKDLDNLKKIKSGPAQIAMIFKFMKALDPQSVVREGEFATAENSAGVPDRISNIYNKILEGERLTSKQMEEFVTVAKQISNSRAEGVESSVDDYLMTYTDNINQNQIDRFKKTAGVKMFDVEPTKEITPAIKAPEAAVNYLRQNPQLAEQFRAKYGYLPEGL